MQTYLKNMLIILTVGAITMCADSKKNFSEETWFNQTSNFESLSLYQDNFKDGKYFNPWLKSDIQFKDLLSWNFSSKPEYSSEENSFLPVVLPNALDSIKNEKSDYILWIGHQTFLIQLSGELFLLDPILTKKAMIPKRKIPPALTIEDINSLNRDITVLITHSHYDHLDASTIKKLNIARIIVPSGLAVFVKKLNTADVIELQWWQDYSLDNNCKLTSLPAQHWSNRFELLRDKSLWCSYLLKSKNSALYLGGDSGYFHGFKEFGKKYKIDYAIFSVGAYHPRWFMHFSHMNIDESLRAFKDMNASKYILAHWGTFKLGDEPVGFPAVELKRKIYERNLDSEDYIIPGIGEIISIKK